MHTVHAFHLIIFNNTKHQNRLNLSSLIISTHADDSGDDSFSLPILQGGIKSVIWTDVFQFVILFVGLIAILILVSLNAYLT